MAHEDSHHSIKRKSWTFKTLEWFEYSINLIIRSVHSFTIHYIIFDMLTIPTISCITLEMTFAASLSSSAVVSFTCEP